MSATRTGLLLAVVAGLVPVARAAETVVEERRPASLDGIVDVETRAGSVKIAGWAKAEVLVRAWFGPGIDGVDVRATSGRVSVEVEAGDLAQAPPVRLEVTVPAGSRVDVKSFAATVDVRGVSGPVRAETVNGSISVLGGAREVDLQAVNGSITLTGGTAIARIETVNGLVTIEGAQGQVNASTVNGRLKVGGGIFDRVRLGTVSANLVFAGGLSPQATLDAETVSGGIEITLPQDVGADFRLNTFSGKIETPTDGTAAGAGSTAATKRHHRWSPEREVAFTMGSGGAKVGAQTLSGAIVIRTDGASSSKGHQD